MEDDTKRDHRPSEGLVEDVWMPAGTVPAEVRIVEWPDRDISTISVETRSAGSEVWVRQAVKVIAQPPDGNPLRGILRWRIDAGHNLVFRLATREAAAP